MYICFVDLNQAFDRVNFKYVIVRLNQICVNKYHIILIKHQEQNNDKYRMESNKFHPALDMELVLTHASLTS